ncbi:ssDNA-binding domain-containing protein [Ruminococcaceae bacterium OttesenSCG-928-L11]|nr:ssDNA-binding domain-containing protein [Ruminococcaceae bacterium OttesenSCG-928-L11]
MADSTAINEITAKLEQGVKDLFQSDTYADYLKTMSRFHSYSTRNTILIHMQHPGATQVAGFSAWKNKFGRNVKKGEKSIKIFAPTPVVIKQEIEQIDPETQRPIIGENGEPVRDEVEIKKITFKLVSVFDASQTEGEPLPTLAQDLVGDVEHYEAFVDALKAVSPLPIEFATLDGEDGRCIYGDKILINSGMSEIQTVCAIIHEICHATLHDRTLVVEGDEQASRPTLSRQVEELQAESVAFSVAAYFNIETGANSFGYLASWSRGRDLKELNASLDTIRKASANLIDDIEARFNEILQERGANIIAAEIIPAEPQEKGEAAVEYTELQQNGFAIAKSFEALPLQERLNIIAQTFGYETAQMKIRPCGGKWRGTSDIAITMGNGVSLFIGNETTSKAKNPDVISEYINSTLAKYNPQTVAEAKRRAYVALIKREAADNAIAAERGLKPYTVLNVELADGKNPQADGYLGWYYITVAVEDKIFGLLESGLNSDIARGAVGKSTVREKYFVAGGLKEHEADFVFNNCGHSSQSDSYKIAIDDSIMARAKEAYKRRINFKAAVAEINATLGAEKDDEPSIAINPNTNSMPGNTPEYQNPWDDPNATPYWQAHGIIADMEKTRTCFGGEERNLIVNYAMHIGALHTGDMDKVHALTSELAAARYEVTHGFANQTIVERINSEIYAADPSLPDPTVTAGEMNDYGYTQDDMLPLSRERAVEMFNAGLEVYLLYPDNTEIMAFDCDEIITFEGIYGITHADWEKSPMCAAQIETANDESKRESDFLHSDGDHFAIYQLKNGDETRDFRFEAMDQLEARGLAVSRENYDLIYTSPLAENDTLEGIYQRFNLDHPEDFTGHSLSVSDVVTLKRGDDITSHYIDGFGAVELPSFTGNERKSQAVPSYSQTGNSFPEKEQSAPKSKPSILGRLEENKRRVAQQSKAAAQKSNTLEV